MKRVFAAPFDAAVDLMMMECKPRYNDVYGNEDRGPPCCAYFQDDER